MNDNPRKGVHRDAALMFKGLTLDHRIDQRILRCGNGGLQDFAASFSLRPRLNARGHKIVKQGSAVES